MAKKNGSTVPKRLKTDYVKVPEKRKVAIKKCLDSVIKEDKAKKKGTLAQEEAHVITLAKALFKMDFPTVAVSKISVVGASSHGHETYPSGDNKAIDIKFIVEYKTKVLGNVYRDITISRVYHTKEYTHSIFMHLPVYLPKETKKSRFRVTKNGQ